MSTTESFETCCALKGAIKIKVRIKKSTQVVFMFLRILGFQIKSNPGAEVIKTDFYGEKVRFCRKSQITAGRALKLVIFAKSPVSNMEIGT